MKTKNLKELKDIINDFENSSGASSIDYEDETMIEQLENLSKDDIEELKDAFYKLDLFYQCIYNG